MKDIQQLYGGVPERLIGAVLKTVVRSRVPWVRIPPPPNKDGLTFVRPVFILCGVGENTLFRGLHERAEAGALLRLRCNLIAKRRIAVTCERVRPNPTSSL